MTIRGWNSKYSEILREFHFKKENDLEAALILDSILDNPTSINELESLIKCNVIFVIGSGYSLKNSISILKKYKKIPKIAADSSIKLLFENEIFPDVVVTDLDGDESSLKKLGKTKTIFLVHAHGDNISKLQFIENFKNCLGTTQTRPVGNVQNFGGFTDGDRCVFLANHFGSKKIVLFGMDLGSRISKFSKTNVSERKIKIKKMKKAKELLEWLATKSRSELYTTSEPLKGFKKTSFSKLDIIIT